jgi:hypothetical protein
MSNVIERLRTISIAPSREGGAFESWIEQNDAIGFLKDNISDQEFVLYAGLPFSFIYAIAAPSASLEPLDVDDLLRWSANPWSSWGIWYSFGTSENLGISLPLNNVGSKTLEKGEQLIYGRRFDGRQEQSSYIEALQKLTHLLDLHYVPERRSYCRHDSRGDVEDIIRIINIPGERDRWGGTIVTINRTVLDEYLTLTEAVIVRVFDFTRFESKNFGGWNHRHEEQLITDQGFHYRKVIEKGHASYSRGFQIVRSTIDRKAIFDRLHGRNEQQKQYASFIAQDWKNNVVTEISCDPKGLANYFTKSDLPFEITPAFFRPDVLLKYKKDPEKYLLEDRSITSHNAWYLETYDINEAGQAHTYLIYLSRLPYDEQLYWKSFNEAPKAPISKRAFTTDIKGEFYDEYEPLGRLKYILDQLRSQGVPWWTLRSEELVQRVHHPVTKSSEEWADELMALDKLLVEGFEERWLRKKAAELGCSPDVRARSLKLMEECLIGLGFENGHARQIMEPFHIVHNLRSELKGHATGDEARKIRASAISEHGTYRKHFESLCARCEESLRQVAKGFDVSLQE